MAFSAHVPNPFPGKFVVLAYDREHDYYVLYVDDDNNSSYKLGSNVQHVLRQFEVAGKTLLGNRIVDLAREFGIAQGVFAGDRAFVVKTEPKPRQIFKNEEQTGYVGATLPPLS